MDWLHFVDGPRFQNWSGRIQSRWLARIGNNGRRRKCWERNIARHDKSWWNDLRRSDHWSRNHQRNIEVEIQINLIHDRRRRCRRRCDQWRVDFEFELRRQQYGRAVLSHRLRMPMDSSVRGRLASRCGLRREQIFQLRGHQAELWSRFIKQTGNFASRSPLAVGPFSHAIADQQRSGASHLRERIIRHWTEQRSEVRLHKPMLLRRRHATSQFPISNPRFNNTFCLRLTRSRISSVSEMSRTARPPLAVALPKRRSER